MQFNLSCHLFAYNFNEPGSDGNEVKALALL